MTTRYPLQHDIPSQQVRGRRARISAVDPDDPHNVWVAFRGERGTPEPAYYPGTTPLTVGKDVRVTAEPELRRWMVHLDSGAEQIVVTQELIVDGRPTNQYQPAQAWKMSASGFGDSFGPADEPHNYSGLAATPIRIAWHPTGKAVLIAPFDSNGDLEIWEWIAGVGFGRKYVVQRLWEASDDVRGIWNAANSPSTSSFDYVRVDTQGNYAFTRDGNYLVMAGSQGVGHEGFNVPIMAIPFSLFNGLDVLHPLYPGGDQNALADGHCVIISQDNEHVGCGTQGSPRIRFWNFSGTGINTVEADPASTPDDPVWAGEFSHAGTFLAVGTDGTSAGDNPKAWNWTPNVGWGAVVSPPASPIGLTDEVMNIGWSQNDDDILVICVTGKIYLYEFDTSGSGAWGARVEVDDWNADALSLYYGSFSPDGTMIVAIGQSGSGPVARLYSYTGQGSATFVEEVSLWGGFPASPSSIGWRP